MNTKQIIILWIGLAIFLLMTIFFAVIVWPTKYKYPPVKGSYNYTVVRINRFTGETEGLHKSINIGWKKLDKEKVKETRELLLPLPYKEKENISGVAYIRDRRSSSSKVSDGFILEIYNGSSYNLKEITILITVKEENGDIRWSRHFQEKVAYEIKPQTSGKFIFEVPRIDEADWSWSIDEYRGTPIIK